MTVDMHPRAVEYFRHLQGRICAALELTDGGGSEAGSAFTTNAVPIAKFSTTFTLQLTNPNADGDSYSYTDANGDSDSNACGTDKPYRYRRVSYSGQPLLDCQFD